MVPHDQHPGVAFSANWLDGFPGIINDDLDSTFAIKKFKASARPALSAFDHLVWQGATSPPDGAKPRHHTNYYEKELPQPQDFVEFGFTKTKPCCMSVSL